MPESLSIVLPLVVAAVVVASGIAKLRMPDDLAGWAELGVPAALRRRWLLVLHPWAEIALGAALVLLGGVLGLLAGLAAVALMAAYLVMVWRVLGREEDASCACFGKRKAVTRVTVARNAWLTAVAAAAASLIWTGPLFGGALATAVNAPGAWGWIVGAAVAAVTTALIVWPEGEPVGGAATDAVAATALAGTAAAAGIGGEDGDELDYVRVRTPAVPVTLGDGTVANLRTLAERKPILLLAVSETCGSCAPVIERVGEYRALLPEVDVRLLLRVPPGVGELTELTEPQSLHDEAGYVSGSISEWATPTAVLLGVDGLLAGGPETGFDDIVRFVEDIHASLHPGGAA